MNIGGLIGRKVGMTRIFTDAGKSIPVTVVEVASNYVTQIKELNKDGYYAIQLSTGEKKPSRVSKPLAGHYAKAQVNAGNKRVEFPVDDVTAYQHGQEIRVENVFSEGQFVDVTATSKGKGFAGGVKRHNFRTQDATHGNSRSHRVLGSIGQNQTPGRVFKGKKMAGHMGNERCTVQSLELIKVDANRCLLMIKGGIPGAPGAYVKIRPAVKIRAEG